VIGLVLAGHGSVRPAAGTAMRRLADLARTRGIAQAAGSGFLNFSRPTLCEAALACVRQGASTLIVQPYFLIAGHYVRNELPRLVEEAARMCPGAELRVAEPLGAHPALGKLVVERTSAALPAAPPGREEELGNDALLLMAHGTPDPAANAPIREVARELGTRGRFTEVAVAFLELNSPSVPQEIDRLVAAGARRIVAVPYFLQLGTHVATQLPELIRHARRRHPGVAVLLAEYLGYHPLLLEVIACRSRAARERDSVWLETGSAVER
jgi:sirohydrochlorin cobaltochelatase